MHESYEDIISRITEPPAWYDQNGTPRYGHFDKDRCPNIYSDRVGLFLIACQSCGRKFNVEMHATVFVDDVKESTPKHWHYGDPPRHVCHGGGDTMNCEDLAVLEFWTRDGVGNWKRRPEFEGVIDE